MERSVDTEIQFSGLKTGVYHYDYTLNNSFFSDYKKEKILDAEVFFDVVLQRKERLLMFHFAFHGDVLTTCDRCLGELRWPVSGENDLCVKFSDTEVSDDEDVIFLPEKAHTIDLAQWMYEYVAVSLPIRCVHPDNPDGSSSCDPLMLEYLSDDSDDDNSVEDSVTGSEQEIDPRWEALRNLKND